MRKPPLLLIPGTLCDDSIWQHQVDNLTEVADVQLIDISCMDSLHQRAEEILELAPEKFALGGFSLGGILAFEILRQAPHRVTKLVLISTNARADTEETRDAKLAQLEMASEQGLEEMMRALLLPHYFASSCENREQLGMHVIEMANKQGIDTFKAQINAVLQRPDSRNSLEHIPCPALVISGLDDVVCPLARHQEIAELIPQAQLKTIQNCGHMSVLEHPQKVTELIKAFLVSER